MWAVIPIESFCFFWPVYVINFCFLETCRYIRCSSVDELNLIVAVRAVSMYLQLVLILVVVASKSLAKSINTKSSLLALIG
jgi:hypothetical protein